MRLQHAAALAQDGVEILILQHALGDQAFGGAQRRQVGTQCRRLDFQAFDVAGRQFDRCHGHDPAAPGDGNQPIGAAILEQAVLGQGAGRDDADNAALDDGFRPAFFRFGRVFQLLADGDAKAQPDQLGDIGVHRVGRHAGQRDVLVAELAALGQGQGQGGRGLDRVVEEQLVEVPHAKEQQGVGIIDLGLQVLRHDRCGAVPLAGGIFWDEVFGGCVHRRKLTFLNRRQKGETGGRCE